MIEAIYSVVFMSVRCLHDSSTERPLLKSLRPNSDLSTFSLFESWISL